MTLPQASADAAAGTTAADYSSAYYASHLGVTDYSWDTPSWRDFFVQAAVRCKAITHAETVLDVGCAKGLFVQALASVGVDATGFDISTHAVESAHEDVRDRIRVASITEPLTARYDLISCIEVLEHLSLGDADVALDNICVATDLVLFSSTPSDFAEPTHVNVQSTAAWAAAFAERGFFRRTDVNLDFLTTWAVLFQRADLVSRDVVHRYEAQYAALHAEVVEKRSALLDSHREILRLVSGDVDPGDGVTERALELQALLDTQLIRAGQLEHDLIEARHDVLTTRDHIIGLEARADELAARLGAQKGRLAKQQDKTEDLGKRLVRQRRRADENQRKIDELLASRSWRIGRALTRPLRRSR